MYGFSPTCPSYYHGTLHNTQFLQEMMQIAKKNVKISQDHVWFFVDHNRRPRAFIVGQKVLLRVLTDSKSLSTSK